MQLRFLVILVLLVSVIRAGQAGVSGKGQSCQSDDDCAGILICSGIESTCVQQALIDTIGGWRIWITTLVFIAVAMLAASAGLGGGGVFVPLFCLIIGMTPQQAIPVSSAAIFGGSIINMVFNVPLKESASSTFDGKGEVFSELKRPLIDFDALMVMMPMLLAGTFIGVILNTIIPSWFLVAVLIVTLGFTSFKSFKKAKKSWLAESEARKTSQEEKKAIEEDSEVSVSVESNHSDNSENDLLNLQKASSDEDQFSKLSKLMKAEIRPFFQTLVMVFLWIFALLFALVRGGKTSSSVANIAFCSSNYWIVTAVMFAMLISFTLVLAKLLYSRNCQKLKLGWKAGDREINWNIKSSLVYPFASMLAGLLGGLIGVGGGMILGPIFLELGLSNRKASASSATSVFITASAATVQYLILNLLIYDYSIWFFSWGLFGTLIGQLLSNQIIKKFNRTSIIAICMTAIVIFACIMMTISGTLSIIEDVKSNNLGFSSFC